MKSAFTCYLWLINWVSLNAATTAVELRAFFDHERRSHNVSRHVRGAAEYELLAGENVTLDCPIDLRDRHLDYCFSYFRSSADDQCAILRDDIAGKMPVDSQHRFELHFASKVHHVTDKTEPVIFVDIGLVNESRLTAFVSARKRLSSHWLLPFCVFSGCPLVYEGRWEAAGVPPPLLKK